jgi:prepilin-type N-terminal cleavage/methylation domain-containing protein
MYPGGRRARDCSRATARGFTLIEMLIIIVIISILAALALPRLDYMRYRVNADARNVVMTLAYAERLAVSLQHNVQVTIDPVNREIRTLEDKNDDGLYSSDERIRGFTLNDGIVFDQNGVADLPAPAATNVVTQITYARDGSANTSGAIFLNTTRGVANGTNEDARGIDIVRSTGRATWYTYTGGSWRRGS